MGAFIKIANREMIDVFKKQYCTENRTIKEESKDGKEGKAIVPAIASFEFDRMAVGEDDDAANNYNSQLIKEKFRQAKASLDVFDQKVLDLKLEGYSIDEMADKLDSCKREIRTSMERIKRKLKADRELEKLCA
jgi:DNA-directed RNA polymerase specialized sigma24 family protein